MSLIPIDVTVPRSVCLSVTFIHCAQTAEDIDTICFAYDSTVSLADRVKIWLTLVNPFVPKFLPQCDPPPLSMSVEDIR